MKNSLSRVLMILVAVMSLSFVSCQQESDERNAKLRSERQRIEGEIHSLSVQKDQLHKENSMLEEKISLNTATLYPDKYMYIVKIKIHQSTFTLDIGEHIKNKMNDIEFEIPVDKAYYLKCGVGNEITDADLKMGSLVMDGDFSELHITITGKRIIRR